MRISALLILLLAAPAAFSQSHLDTIRTEPEKVEKLGANLYRIGTVRVDTSKREATVDGKVTGAKFLEFIASTKSGFRSYESAFELNTDALSFNVAMILIGLDKANSVASRFHFDPNPPQGDPVEIWVEWGPAGSRKKHRAEEMLIDTETKKKFPKSDWVYAGSSVLEGGKYRAEADGVIIGFVHDPASIIESALPNGVGRFGFIQLDSSLGLEPETPITLTVKSTKKAGDKR